jgi:hypothetical protein
MIESEFDTWEKRLRDMTAEMAYPPTPDIAAGVRQRLAGSTRLVVRRPWYANRLAWVVTAVLLAAALLLAVPEARAAIFEFFQIGDIRIFPNESAVTPGIEEPSEIDVTVPTVTAEPTGVPGFTAADLYGETTLAELRQELGGGLIRPDYPMGVGVPDRVYLQNVAGPVGILVWLETDSEDKAWAILYILTLDQGAFGSKFQVESLKGTEVNGQPAYWVEGQHLLSFYDEDGRLVSQSTRLVEGNTLIWTVDNVTYRLETVLSLEEAVRMAESMR